MISKKKLTLAAVAALALVVAFSCAKPLPPLPEEQPDGEGEIVSVPFLVRAEDGTKVTGAVLSDEENLVRWTVFAFDAETGWFRWVSSSGSATVHMNLRAGRTYRCYALVNYAISGSSAFDPETVTNETSLRGKVAYLGDNGRDRLMMYGGPLEFTPVATYYDPTLVNPTEYVTKVITVHRIISKVNVNGVSVDFSTKPVLASKTFTLKHIYMDNVYRTTRFGSDYAYSELSASRVSWYNTGGRHRGEAAVLGIDALVEDRDINRILTTGGTAYSTVHSFYVFPNATPLGSDQRQMDSWTKRCTRVVLEATIDAETVYYAVTVPDMLRNHVYTASNIVIHGRGSNDPELLDYDEDVIDVTFSVSTDGWEDPVNVEENS